VVAVARTGQALAELATTSANIRTEVADAAEETVAWSLLDQYEPEVLILVMSSGAAVNGSPASGGYAGSKATQRFIAGYAQDDSLRRRGQARGPGVHGPRRPDRGGIPDADGELLTPEMAGSALVDLVRADSATTAPGCLLTGAGLQKLP
jgi:hypothetical protein